MHVVVRGPVHQHEVPPLELGRLLRQVRGPVALVVPVAAARGQERALARGRAHVALGVRGICT